MTSSNKPPRHNPFANKADLEAAQRRIAELEAELATVRTSPLGSQIATLQKQNAVVKVQPLAVAPNRPTNAATAPAVPLATNEAWKPSAPPPRLTKEQFAVLSPTDKMSFSKAGGRISN
jgi:hypothetical protein